MLGLSFGNGITLVHFEQQATRLFAASDHLDCRYVRAFFKKKGTPVAQYIEPNLSNIYDTTEDIIALGNEMIAFYVTPASYRLCKQLASVLKELDERYQIVWFGDLASRIDKEALKGTVVDGIVRWNPESTLHKLLNTETDDWSNVNGFESCEESKQSTSSEEVPTILTDGGDEATITSCSVLDELPGAWEETAGGRQAVMLSVKCADRLGSFGEIRKHSPERFKRDFELAVSAARQMGPCFTIEGFDKVGDESAREPFMEVLAENMSKASYRVAIPLKECSCSMLERLSECGVTQIEVKVPISIAEEASQDNEIINYMKNMKQKDARITISITLVELGNENEQGDAAHTVDLLVRWLAEGIIDIRSIRAESDERDTMLTPIILPKPLTDFLLQHLQSEPETALLNGYLAYMTGFYPQQIIGGGVKHIGFTEGSLDDHHMNRLGEYSGLNSALLFEYNQVNREVNNDLIYFDTDGVWKRDNDKFKLLTEAADKKSYYLSNAHQVIPTKEYEYTLQMNDFLHVEPIQIRQMDYLKAAEMEPNADEVDFQMLNITSTEDLNAYLEDIEHFSQTGTFRSGYEIKSYLIDSCRWSSAHYCRAKQLPRLFIDGEMTVSACRGCSALGDIGDSLDSLLMSAAVVSDQEQLLRGCGTCEIKDSCSKCTFLPAYMNRQQYCEIRKKHKMLHRYMQAIQLFKGLSKYSQALSGINTSNLRVSLPTCTHLYPFTSKLSQKSAVAETVYLFFVKDAPMVYQATSQKVLKLNEPMALILEGLMIGADVEELKQVLIERYQVDGSYAYQSMQQAMDLFVREGCLLFPVKAS